MAKPRPARGSFSWVLVALFLIVGGLEARQARGDIEVHVLNCTSDDLEVQSYDAKDSVKLVAATTKKLNQKGESATLKCAGEGKGYCQMIIAITDLPLACNDPGGSIAGSLQFHLDSGKWAVVTGFETETNSKGNKTCKPITEENLDSAPSCS